MKLSGEFVVRQVMDNTVAIPVGQTALKLSGMILLNDVSHVIWECLQQETTVDAIVAALTEQFEVTPEEARADTQQFLQTLEAGNFLDFT